MSAGVKDVYCGGLDPNNYTSDVEQKLLKDDLFIGCIKRGGTWNL